MSNKKINNNLKDGLLKKTNLPWFEPLDLAQKISANYKENWVFLYSGLSNQQKSSRSFIAVYENQKYRGNNFDEFEKIVAKGDDEMWFGGLNYEALDIFDKNKQSLNPQHYLFNQISYPSIFFSQFDLVFEFLHDKKNVVVHARDDEKISSILSFQNKPYQGLISVAKINSNFSDSSYKKSIEELKKMIANGDFYQANLTRKFFGEFDKKLSNRDNFNLFTDLVTISPANYSCFMKFDDLTIISSSPELFLRSKNNIIYSKPIKGTIKRGKTQHEDNINRLYLKNSLKEKAENLMIVDLMRNDFARFCAPKSVRVNNLFKISTYKTIFHLSSQIKGKIAKNYSLFDVVRNCFPAGSMTGAPKIKVIETLRNYEKIQRGIYSGALGYFWGKKAINLSVVIRTLIIKNDKFEFQVGGGITFDSDAESELQETYSKANAILQILKLPKKFRHN